jgi:hypothetical protein
MKDVIERSRPQEQLEPFSRELSAIAQVPEFSFMWFESLQAEGEIKSMFRTQP